ncbi:hypothetical protein HYDPIDRAFT_168613 [Hydnomerulius pinastri MD-312]|uniref:REJ domain-containing protein n=1 Tax=Hydnomerulius pinastri MD-312 TaxID=994086 RepID=A0A0C9WEL1_9AGAM|nr:hypothetical protein HYDPIDRAFT_168613 [Hydnomerulius pinastri MD-312]
MSTILPVPSSQPPSSAPTSAPPSSTAPPPPSTSTPPNSTSTPQQTPTSTTLSSSSASQSTAQTTPSSLTALTTSSTPLSSTPVVTSSGGQVYTVTAVVTPTLTNTPAPNNNNSTSTNSFFHNTGAVAGVFAVVGLIVVAILIALVTNAVRRRRAQKFDRDVAEAAAEAAASSRSPFDDYGGGGGDRGAYGYSDSGHGTFQQPPMPHHNGSYGMSEMSQHDPYAAGAAGFAAAAVDRSRSRKESEPGAPGIAGVGAGNLAREPSRRNPYHAFAGPGPQPHELQDSPGSLRYRRGPANQDILEAAGLAGTGAAAMAANNANSGAFINRRPSEYTQHTHQSGGGRSQGYGSSNDSYPTQLQPGYQADPYYPRTRSADPFAGQPTPAAYPQRSPSPGLPNPHDAPSPPATQNSGHTFGEHEHEDDFHEGGSPAALRDDERMSYQDDNDYSQGSRVLRVANE